MQKRKSHTVFGSGIMVKRCKDTLHDCLFPTGASQARARNVWRLVSESCVKTQNHEPLYETHPKKLQTNATN